MPKVKKVIRKRRKPMSEEQRAAAVERLAKAREKRLRENPPEYKNIHPTVLAKGKDDEFNLHEVRQWIKTQKELLAVAKSDVRRNVSGAEAKVASISGYIRHMEHYLRNGDWINDFYGEYEQHKCRKICLVPAYDSDGNIKRTKGVFYEDINAIWGEHTSPDMENA